MDETQIIAKIQAYIEQANAARQAALHAALAKFGVRAVYAGLGAAGMAALFILHVL